MKSFSVYAFVRSRYLLAIVAGLLLAASFPKMGIAGFAWIAPALMLVAASGKNGRERFRIGYVAGLAHYLVSLYWLLLIPVKWFPILGWVALAAFLALFPATWVWLCEIKNSTPINREQELKIKNSGEDESRIADWSWGRRALWALLCAAIWVALEMIIARIFSGFPWNLLGASQFRIVPLIQIASVTGVYGVSFLIVWTSVSLLCAAMKIIRRPGQRVWVSEIILPFVALAAVFVFGFHQLSQSHESDRKLKVTLVQPSIPQTFIWDSAKDDERFQELIRLSEIALTNQTDLLLWPEAAIPQLLRQREIFQPVAAIARAHHVWMIVGADDADPRPTPANTNGADFFNSSFLINPDGELMNSYRKRNLVIFGEYIPLVRWLPFIKWFTPIQGGYASGKNSVPFILDDLKVKTTTLICFEDNFPHLVRRDADDDTDFLVNITNNGWFGEGAAQWQHAANAIFRAIENGLPLVRCSNNGLTCWVDANGRLRKILTDDNGSIYSAGFMTAEIPLLPEGEKRVPTFYNRHGDLFGWACVGFTGLVLLLKFSKAERTRFLNNP